MALPTDNGRIQLKGQTPIEEDTCIFAREEWENREMIPFSLLL